MCCVRETRLAWIVSQFEGLSFGCVLRDSTPSYVSPLVGGLINWSVGWSPFYFFGVFELFEPTAPAQMFW